MQNIGLDKDYRSYMVKIKNYNITYDMSFTWFCTTNRAMFWVGVALRSKPPIAPKTNITQKSLVLRPQFTYYMNCIKDTVYVCIKYTGTKFEYKI